MADFSLTTLFVVPVGQTALPSSGSTQNLTAGQVGIFKSDYCIMLFHSVFFLNSHKPMIMNFLF